MEAVTRVVDLEPVRERNAKFYETILSSLSEDLTEEKCKKLLKVIPEAVQKVTLETSASLKKGIVKDMQSKLEQNEEWRKGFESHIYEVWKKPFDLLEVFISISREAGEAYNKKHRPIAVETHDCKFEALTGLHSRACLIGSSAMALLRTGYPDMAHATWRSLHELAIVAVLINENDNETAEKYLLHDYVDVWKAQSEHYDAKSIHHLVPCEYSEEEVRRSREIVDKLAKQYGPEFLRPNGWAYGIINNSPSGKIEPSMKALEKEAGLDHLRPYYKMASYNVHPDLRGVRFKLGLADGGVAKNVLLAGPSVFGMADPGHSIAISLQHINVALLSHNAGNGDEADIQETITSQATLQMLNTWVEDLGDAFGEVHEKLAQQSQ